MNKVCLIYRDHKLEDWSLERFNRIKQELRKSEIDLFHDFSNDIPNYKIYKPALYYQFNPIMNNPEILTLSFYLKNNSYDYYFHMDNDAHFNGNILDFLKDLTSKDFDFLSSYIYSKEEYYDKYNQENMWIPKPHAFPQDYKIYHAFIPFNGYSNKYLNFLNNFYGSQGIPAFCEVSLPTLAYNNNFKIFDLAKTNYIDDNSFAGKAAAVDRLNMLYHHVKHRVK
jgi:hypothetical protein